MQKRLLVEAEATQEGSETMTLDVHDPCRTCGLYACICVPPVTVEEALEILSRPLVADGQTFRAFVWLTCVVFGLVIAVFSAWR